MPSSPAFTFVEILIALLLLVILVSVVAPALIGSLRAEQTAALMEAGHLAADRVIASVYVGGPLTNALAEMKSEWTGADRIEQPAGTNRVTWQVWELAAVDRPSLRVRFAIRRPAPHAR